MGTDALGSSDAGADHAAAGGASGSGAGGAGIGGAGGSDAGNDGAPRRDAGSVDREGDIPGDPGICAVYRFPAGPQPIDLFIVLDRSASMQEDFNGMVTVNPADPSKWSQTVPALTDLVSAPGTSYRWGLKVFPEGIVAQCAPTSVTNAINVPVAAANGGAVSLAIRLLQPNGNGTPTAAAIGVAAAYLATLADQNPKYLLLITDGAPNCTGNAGSVMLDPTNAAAATVNAVSAAAQAGYHTFVVGVGGTAATVQDLVLNQLALAGLEPRSPLGGPPYYYLATDGVSLNLALQTVTGRVLGCLLPLSAPPPAPDNVTIRVDGQVIAHDPSHTSGWDYTDSRDVAVQLYGAPCDGFRQGTVGSVQIDLGCSPLPPDAGSDARDAGTM